MDKRFEVGGFCFRLCCPDGLAPANLMKFAADAPEDYTYRMSEAKTLPLPAGDCLARREDAEIYTAPAGEARLLGARGVPGWLACYEEVSPREARIVLAPGWRPRFAGVDTAFTGLLALERRVLPLGGLVLHCAFADWEGEALLFSGPSGIGKSTQAGLWQKYRGARILNGDRALLLPGPEDWTAGGWPVCGSSEICFNQRRKLRAIVLPTQETENFARRLRPAAAFAALYGQVTVNRWNPTACARAADLLEQLCRSVPVWRLGCTISQNAVDCLAAALAEEGGARHETPNP